MILALFITILATLAGLLLSSLHMALRDYSMIKFEELAQNNGGMERVEPILKDVSGHVLAVGFLRVLCTVAITVGVILAFGVFRVEAEPLIVGPVEGPGALEADAGAHLTVSYGPLIGAFLVASGLIYFFCTVLPMSIAEHAGERLIYRFAPFLRAIHWLAAPIRIVTLLDGGIRRLAGAHHTTDQQEIEEEILSVVSEGERDGSIGETEREMIESVVEFRQLSAKDVMTPRTEIVGLELTDDLRAIRDFVKDCGHSRIPVYVGDLDHIVGVLYAKDLLRYIAADATGFKLKPLLRPAVFVLETKMLSELLHELRARKVHVAMVIDEHGGTTGLVSFEDILEEIVGDIQDEYEPTEPEQPEIVVNETARSAELEARAYIEDANEALAPIGVTLPEDAEFDTVGGYVLDALGRIPVPGESFSTDSYTVTVLDAETTRVTRLRIEAKSEGDDEEEEAGSDLSESKHASLRAAEAESAGANSD